MNKRTANVLVIFTISIIALSCANIFAFMSDGILIPDSNNQFINSSVFDNNNSSDDSTYSGDVASESNNYESTYSNYESSNNYYEEPVSDESGGSSEGEHSAESTGDSGHTDETSN
ncbi:hypothetical protein [Methanobrevibacter sp. DSM 116169]|uniref:hypothetical protein n=1 Tax=Methanobrevibacter sp. DSM 116169 TaxID=3242727 RepID=UPI0038FC396D